MLGRRMALAGTAALAVGIGFTGFANASTMTPAPGLVVTVDASSLAGIFPGASRPVTYTVTNPASNRTVTLHDADAAGRVDGSLSIDRDHAACDVAWFSFTPDGDEADSYGPGASSTYTGAVQMVNADVNQDACKGATISLTVAVAP